MSDLTRRYIDLFWELIDRILNAVLFVLIGMEVVLESFSGGTLVAAAAAIVLTLSARALTVGIPVALMKRSFKLPQGAGWVLTWAACAAGSPWPSRCRCRPARSATSSLPSPIASSSSRSSARG